MRKEKTKTISNKLAQLKNWYASFRNKPLLISVSILALVFFVGFVFVLFDKAPEQAANTVTPGQAKASAETPAWWLSDYFGSSVCETDNCRPENDPDNDKLTNAQEYYYHSHPMNAHTVGDEMTDGELVAEGFDPSRPGRMTFETVESQDNILGESLVFDQDIKEMVAEDANISKVKLDLIEEVQLNVTTEVTEEVYTTYVKELGSKVEKYFPASEKTNYAEIIKSANGPELDAVKTKALMLSTELKGMIVPEVFVAFHKYHIAFYRLLGEILPGPEVSIDPTDTVSADAWYDKVQAFMAIQQKLNFEKEFLSKRFAQ